MTKTPPLAVVAVGGNALISDRDHVSLKDQAAQAMRTCEHIADIVAAGWRVVVTHGNGPQVGFILHRSELAKNAAPEVPLVYAVADTQGAIGFMMQQGLHNALAARDIPAQTVTVVTRVVVDADDPSFQRPVKPIGAHLDEPVARQFADQFGWTIAEDSGRGWRRVVASPTPRRVVELPAIRHLLREGQLVVTGGGGGIPVIERDGTLEGVDAVIDKDATSSLLAHELGADAFIILTDVDRVALNYGTPDQQELDELDIGKAEELLAQGHFGEGSMAPKVRACVNYLQQRPQGTAIITNAGRATQALQGVGGTRFRNALAGASN